jgi:hypothetical protein
VWYSTKSTSCYAKRNKAKDVMGKKKSQYGRLKTQKNVVITTGKSVAFKTCCSLWQVPCSRRWNRDTLSSNGKNWNESKPEPQETRFQQLGKGIYGLATLTRHEVKFVRLDGQTRHKYPWKRRVIYVKVYMMNEKQQSAVKGGELSALEADTLLNSARQSVVCGQPYESFQKRELTKLRKHKSLKRQDLDVPGQCTASNVSAGKNRKLCLLKMLDLERWII